MKKSIKVLLIILVVIEIISTYFMYKSGNNKNIILDKVELKDIINTDRIAIMTDEDGSGTYKEYTGTTWPSPNYLFNSSKTTCINEKGDKVENAISYDSSTNKAQVLTGETTYCTLYFDKCLGPKGTVLEGKSQSQITTCPVGGLYRYQGTDDVNNWICFGTTSNCSTSDDLIDKYMYRIIGVTPDGQLALIKETGVKEGTTTTFQWNDKYTTTDCGTDGSKCTWATSKLYNRLNGLCNEGNENCNGTGTGTKGQSNIFIGNSYYEYLNNSSAWYSKISNHTWKYGDTNHNNGSYNGDAIYAIESKFSNSIQAKIGLQYIHDYYYAYPGGKPVSISTAKTSWIHLSKDEISGISYEWLISQYGVSSTNVTAWNVGSYGSVTNNYLPSYYGVRPVFYLTSDTTFKSGTTGSKDNPYIINISLGEFCAGQTNMAECITNKESTIGDVTNLTSNEVGGMYRYQGTDDVNNYICFGTSNKEECTKNYDAIDKYMYRVIGVTPDGELALIKETGVKETGSTNMNFQWNDKYSPTENECGTNGEKCTWPLSTLYNRLNGLCKSENTDCDGTGSGTTGQSNIFIGNSYYEYLNNNSTWLSKISDHEWKYGDTNKNNGSYNGDTIYAIENAFKDSIPSAKIGLQYQHDYYYAYPGGKPVSYSTAKNAWIFFRKDGYNTGITNEWLISRYGVTSIDVCAWGVYSYGDVGNSYLCGNVGVRPVFYLTPSVKISNTTGGKTDPFLIMN